MEADIQALCPRCKSPDNLRRVCEVYQHYQNKVAVKKFFGEEVCEMPDYLKDTDLELLEKKGEYELTQGEMRVADDATSDFSDMISGTGSDRGNSHVAGKSQEILIETVSPPPEPRLVRISLALMIPVVLGTTLLAFVFAAFMMNEKPGLLARIALPAGLSLVVIAAVIFIAISFHNAGLLRAYETSRAVWKNKLVCNHCRTVFTP